MSKMRMKADPTMLKGGVATWWGPAELWTCHYLIIYIDLSCHRNRFRLQRVKQTQAVKINLLLWQVRSHQQSGPVGATVCGADPGRSAGAVRSLGGWGVLCLTQLYFCQSSLSCYCLNAGLHKGMNSRIVYISSQREIYKDLTDYTKQLNITNFYFTCPEKIFFSCPFFVIHKTDFKHFEISNIALLNLDRLLCKFELKRVFKLHCCTILIHSKISLLLW